jgi:hypothetical protein
MYEDVDYGEDDDDKDDVSHRNQATPHVPHIVEYFDL